MKKVYSPGKPAQAKVFIADPVRPNWPARENDLKEMFGLDRKAKWPAEGMRARVLQGITIWVMSIAEAKVAGRFHRVHVKCPVCGAIMSAGRLAQHVCPIETEELAENVPQNKMPGEDEFNKAMAPDVPLDKGFVEAMYGPIHHVWQAIAEEGIDCRRNDEAMELALDANRLTTFGYPDADKLLDTAITKHGYVKVERFLCRNIQLV